jgi:uncharacterized protein YndB with AHSA1/START domain
MNGKLEQAGDRWRLRFERELAHTPEKVWRALTEHEHLQAWFPHTIVGEWTVGAPLRFESKYGDFDGEVLAVQPPSLLEFRWGPDTIRFEVASASGGDRCTLTLIDTLDQVGKAARDGPAGTRAWMRCRTSSTGAPAQRSRADVGRRCTPGTSRRLVPRRPRSVRPRRFSPTRRRATERAGAGAQTAPARIASATAGGSS